LGDILTAIKAGIVAGGLGLTANQVIIVLKKEPYPNSPSSAGEYVTISPGDFRTIDGQVSGGGRFFTGLSGEIYIRVYALSANDEPNVDEQRTLLLLGMAHDIVNFLQLFFPLTGIGTMMAEQPIRLTSQSQPIRYSKAGEWISVELPFELEYYMSLDTSVNV
jgi:hypothetical protein